MKIASIQSLDRADKAAAEARQDRFDPVRRLQVPVWIYDIDLSRVAYANKAACKLWQAETEEELCDRDMEKDMSSTVAKRLKQYQNDFIENDATFTEMWTLYPNGLPQNVMVIFSGYTMPDGRMAMQCEVVGDTEDEPQNVRSAEALLHTDVMIMLVGKEGLPLYMNPAARNVIPEGSARFIDFFVNPADYTDLVIALTTTGERRLVTEVITANGHRWYDVSAKSCSDAATGEPAILVTAIDVSELKTARDTARFLADRDQLTGCYNRSFLQGHLSELSRDLSPPSCAIIFFDVDRFKQINDRFGHEIGDTVLKQIADRSRNLIRENDMITRLGGDEFVILLHDVGSDSDLDSRIEELRKVISRPIFHDATRINSTVSMGVTRFVPGELGFAEVISQADIALYASKQAGRNRATHFNEEMGRAARERDELEEQLKHALQRREFTLHYQPRVDLRTGRVVSVEGLVRWNHPERGLVMPDSFIPVCEENGMIEDLGRLVLEMGCNQAIAWREAGLEIEVSLNISPRQFKDRHLLRTLHDLSNTPGFPKGKIELEITESVLFGDHHMIAKKLQTITKMGYRIAIDDFGTGYSNLSYISRFPLKCLKIDRSFIDQLPGSGPIISLILTLARQIGATAVAEGIETAEQRDWLATQKCEQAQGYYLSKPVPLDAFEGVVEDLNARAQDLPRVRRKVP